MRRRFGYAFNILIDTPTGVAIDVEASPAWFAAEVDAARVMLSRAGDRFGYRPKRVAADTAYGSGAFLAFVNDRKSLPHISVLERSEQTRGKFPRAAFRYEREQDRNGCPTGKALAYKGSYGDAEFRRYYASAVDCRPCPLKGNARQARSVRSGTASMRTCVRWSGPRCRPGCSSNPCGSARVSSRCSRMPRASADWPGFTFAGSAAQRRSSRWASRWRTSCCLPVAASRLRALFDQHRQGTAKWSGSAEAWREWCHHRTPMAFEGSPAAKRLFVAHR